MDFSYMEFSKANLHTFLELTRNSCENATIYRPTGRNRTCGVEIPIQRSNQLMYSDKQRSMFVLKLKHSFILYFVLHRIKTKYESTKMI